MIDADQDVGESGGEVEQIVEELNARVDAGDEVVAREVLEAGPPGGIDEIATLAEIADAADSTSCNACRRWPRCKSKSLRMIFPRSAKSI